MPLLPGVAEQGDGAAGVAGARGEEQGVGAQAGGEGRRRGDVGVEQDAEASVGGEGVGLASADYVAAIEIEGVVAHERVGDKRIHRSDCCRGFHHLRNGVAVALGVEDHRGENGVVAQIQEGYRCQRRCLRMFPSRHPPYAGRYGQQGYRDAPHRHAVESEMPYRVPL